MIVNGKKIRYLYMATTTDKYELPIAVADSGKELADMLGLEPSTVYISLSLGRPGYHKIYVGDER